MQVQQIICQEDELFASKDVSICHSGEGFVNWELCRKCTGVLTDVVSFISNVPLDEKENEHSGKWISQLIICVKK